MTRRGKTRNKKNYQAPKTNIITLIIISLLVLFISVYFGQLMITPQTSTDFFGGVFLQSIGYEYQIDLEGGVQTGHVVRARETTSEQIKEDTRVLVSLKTWNETTEYQFNEEQYPNLFIEARIAETFEDGTFYLSFRPETIRVSTKYSIEDIQFYIVREAEGFGNFLYALQDQPEYFLLLFALTVAALYWSIYLLILRRDPNNLIEDFNQYSEKRLIAEGDISYVE